MPYLIRHKIGLQLLSLYLLFIIPVLLGGAALYVFQQSVLTQNAFQSDLALSQAVALEVGANLRAVTEIDSELSSTQAAKVWICSNSRLSLPMPITLTRILVSIMYVIRLVTC